MSLLLMGCSGAENSITIPTRSIDFERGGTQFLSMSDANFGAFNRDKFGFATWLRIESLSSTNDGEVLSQGSGSNCGFFMGVHNTGGLTFNVYTNGSAQDGILISTTTLSLSTWYHVYWQWDGQNATANNRMRIWLNGSEISSFSSRTNPPQTSIFNSTAAIQMGKESLNNIYYDGLLYQPAFFSTTTPSISNLITGTSPKDVSSLPGLYSLLQTTGSSVLEDDYVLSTNWTNTNTVTKSTTVPA